MSFRLVPKSLTLNDLERRNGRYFASFHRIRIRCRPKAIITSVSKSILIVYDHINTISRLLNDYLGKTRGGNSLHFTCL